MIKIPTLKNTFTSEIRPFLFGAAATVSLMMVIFRSSPLATIKLSALILAAFYLPGYLLGLHLIIESRLVSTILGVGVIIAFWGTLSYLLGQLNIHVKYHAGIIIAATYTTLLILTIIIALSAKNKYE